MDVTADIEYSNITLTKGIDIASKKPILGFVKQKDKIKTAVDTSSAELLGNKVVGIYGEETLLFDDAGIIVVNNDGRHHYDFENVSSFIKDSNGNYWVSTLSNGIYLIPSFDFQFIKKSDLCTSVQGDKLNDIIYIDKNILIGTKKGKIIQLNPATNSCSEVGEVNRQIDKLSKAHNRLFLSYGYEILEDNHEVVYHPGLYDAMTLQEFGKGYVGFGSSHSLIIYDEDDAKLRTVFRHDYARGSRTLSICPINAKELYFSSFNGLYHMAESGEIQEVSGKFYQENITIRKILYPQNDLLLLGSSGDGLLIKYRDSIFQLSKKEGLNSNFINDVISIDSVIWCATNTGISRIAFETENSTFTTLNINNYTITEGLGANYITKLELADDKIWALSNDGIMSFDREINIVQNKSPEVIIEGLLVGDSLYKGGTRFEYDQNRIEIPYLAISIRKNTSGRFYKYRLKKDGEYGDWNYTDNRSVAFDELGDGLYEFSISCRVANGNWSTPGKIKFEIAPYFFDQLWVRVTGLFILSLIVFSLYKLDLARRKKRYLEKLKLATTTNRLNKLELDVLRGQMNPHFIYNALNSVQKFLLKEDKIGANKFISRLAKMLRSGLEYSRSTSISIEQEISFLDNYLKIETQRFPDRFSYEIISDPQLEGVQIPPLMVQPLCENAIKHAFRNEKVNIQINISKASKGTLSVEVNDTGVGYLNTVKKNTKSKSLGIDILMKRLLVFAEKGFEVSCKFMYLDQASKVGTKVKLILPILK